jgi:hypothetical protein
VPAGWSVCDGTSGTPDLRDRFVLGQTSTIGEIAGDTDHAHSGESDPTSLTTSTASPGGRSCSYPGCWCTMKSYTASHSHTFNHSHLVEDDTLQPPFYEVIFLMNTGAESILPGTIFAYSSTHTALSDDWEVCDGAGVCPDLRGRFLKGAPDGTGSGATGGSVTHDHSEATDVATSTSSYSGGGRVVSSGGASATDSNHSHGYEHDHWLTTEEHLPPYLALSWVTPLESAGTEQGAIAMWFGAIDDLPAGWRLCDGTEGTPDLQGYFIRGASSDSEIGTEGGTESHDHALASDEGGDTSLSGGGNGSCTDGGDLMAFHSHSMPSHGHSLASTDHAPPSMTMAYIMYAPE